MMRDYSKFLPTTAPDPARPGETAPRPEPSLLQSLGWQPFFSRQVGIDEMTETPPVRITEVHRNGLLAVGEGIETLVPPGPEATVGDWLLLDRAHPAASRVLERKSLIKRLAPGSDRQVQLIAANIDTVFIVTSCNQDFNLARLERYIALAFEADVSPVILLTKTDLCDAPETYVEAAAAISELVPVVTLDARGDEPPQRLAQWCKPGRTLAFLGSSGVGKSTLVNALSGTRSIETRAIREDDARGRHTTTRRQLYRLASGCSVLDTPGMRELQLIDAGSGVADVFSDLHALSTQCRFRDCRHETEPGCAVRAALETGEIEETRMDRWQKLVAEDWYNSASLSERRSKDKTIGKFIRKVQKNNRK